MAKNSAKEKPRKKGETDSETEPELVVDDTPKPKPTVTKSPKKVEKRSEIEKVITERDLNIILELTMKNIVPSIEDLETLFEFPLNEVNKILNMIEENYPHNIKPFQTVEKKTDRLNAALKGLMDSESKDWSAMAMKVTEVYKLTADLAYVIWGRNAKKEKVLRTAHAEPDWSGKPMMELTQQLLNGTCGLDWQMVRDSHQLIQQVQGDLGRIREEFRLTVGNEFSTQFGTTLGDFSGQWAKLGGDLDDIRSAIANITTVTNKAQVSCSTSYKMRKGQ